MVKILSRYVSAESAGARSDWANEIYDEQLASIENAKSGKSGENDKNWYCMVCPRCPWFVDGEKTGQYTYVVDKRDTGDSGRIGSNDTPWDEELDELLDDVNAKYDENDDIIGRSASDILNDALDKVDTRNAKNDAEWNDYINGKSNIVVGENLNIGGGSYSNVERHEVPVVRCIRPEKIECLGESLCVQLIIIGDLLRQQQALEAMQKQFAHQIVGTDENRKQIMNNVKNRIRSRKTLKRNRKLIKAAKKRGR